MRRHEKSEPAASPACFLFITSRSFFLAYCLFRALVCQDIVFVAFVRIWCLFFLWAGFWAAFITLACITSTLLALPSGPGGY